MVGFQGADPRTATLVTGLWNITSREGRSPRTSTQLGAPPFCRETSPPTWAGCDRGAHPPSPEPWAVLRRWTSALVTALKGQRSMWLCQKKHRNYFL